AMASERLRLPGHSEISAVCTHPEYQGRGYASFLIKMLVEHIRSRGELPFLHVRSANTRAIQVYERLGFWKRATLNYAVLRHDIWSCAMPGRARRGVDLSATNDGADALQHQNT